MATLSADVLIDRHDFSKTRRVAGAVDEDTELSDGQVLLGLEKFALTANNISYAASGD
jgi:hypothetical protein